MFNTLRNNYNGYSGNEGIYMQSILLVSDYATMANYTHDYPASFEQVFYMCIFCDTLGRLSWLFSVLVVMFV